MVLVVHDTWHGVICFFGWKLVGLGHWTCPGVPEHHMFGEMPGQWGPAAKAGMLLFARWNSYILLRPSYFCWHHCTWENPSYLAPCGIIAQCHFSVLITLISSLDFGCLDFLLFSKNWDRVKGSCFVVQNLLRSKCNVLVKCPGVHVQQVRVVPHSSSDISTINMCTEVGVIDRCWLVEG
jgi:hypothetical protein